MTFKDRQRIRALWAQVPDIKCKGLCFDSCGPLGMTPMEKLMLDRAAGHEVTTEGLRCTALGEDNRCIAYESRPLICRLWGVAQGMLCEHGCEVQGDPLNFAEAAYLVDEIHKVSPGAAWTMDYDLIRALHERQGHSAEQTLDNIFSGRQWKENA